MLIPEQVVPFLLHEKWTLRHHAQRYIEGANPVAPLTADHLWEAADRVDEREAASYYRLLREAPQTERSWQRMRDRLAGHVNSIQGHHLQHAAGTIDWWLLRSHREEILGCASLLPHVRHHLEQRLILADQPPTEAWDELMQHGRELGGRNVGRFDDRLSRRLIEAAARQPGELIERAIQTMNDPAAAEDWRQIFAVQFLGAVHPERAIDPLVEQFSVDADYLRERVCDALVAIGSPEVVQKVRAFYPAASWDARLYARDVFGRIKRAESEAALAELIELEQDEELLVMLLQELCQLESLCGLERSRELIASDSRNPEHEDLAAALLAASIMSGVELPEARAWGKIAGRLQAKYRAALQDFGDDLSADFRETWGRTGQILPDSDGDRDSDDSIGMDASAPPPYEPAFSETFRREGPKIGRNDPCPCGSGKKYKKCCGANA